MTSLQINSVLSGMQPNAPGHRTRLWSTWRNSICRSSRTMKASTYAGYSTYWKRYIKPRIGEYALRDFTVAIVAGLLKNIANQQTLNRDTVTKIRSILSGIFTYAMCEGHFPGRNALENPASRARIPESAVERVEPKAAARDEVKVILTTLKDMPLERAAVAVVAMLGVRPGEARGLRWENWDRVKEQIAVRRSVAHNRRHSKDDSERAVPAV